MEWCGSVVIAEGAVFICVYSLHLLHRLQEKVGSPYATEISTTQMCLRIIIVSICNLGLCLCPQCTIPMVCMPNMGMHQDLVQCVSLAHVNNVDQCTCIHAVHQTIYENNHPVDGVAIKRLLHQDSLVPNAVSVFF